MELSQVLGMQYAFHGLIAGFVLILAVLVFVFGFKAAEEPPFDKLTDDRKSAGKKRKIKEKKSQLNGHATAVVDGGRTPKKEEKKELEKSPAKSKSTETKKSPSKTALKETKNVKSTKSEETKKVKGKGKENVEVKQKKKVVEEKPKDFDDGEWEQALSRKDKKNRKTTLEEIQLKSEKKKDKKKPKEEKVAETEKKPEPETPVKEAEPIKVETVSEVAEEKPKKLKKKKQPAEAPQLSEPKAKPRDPSPQKIEEKVEKIEKPPLTAAEISDSLAFDELGDTWKEARPPKKSNKKKSRKD